MKVLHLTGECEDSGGVLSVLRNLAVASAPLGWGNSVWVNEAYVEKRLPALDYRRSRHIVGDSSNHLLVLWHAMRAFPELKGLLQREQFDVVHAHSRGGLLAGMAVAKLLKRPVIFTNHNYARRLDLYRWAARQERVFTVLLTPRMVAHYGLEAGAGRLAVISACCADRFFEVPLLGAGRVTADAAVLRLSGVGSLVRWKRWDLVASALMQLAETERSRVEFNLWGPTPDTSESRQYEQELRAVISRNRLERQFVLRGALTSVPEALRETEWMVHPATNEPCSVAVMEAMALGIPVLASSSGGMVDIIEPGKNGLLFTPDDPRTLADQIRRILRGRVQVAAPEAIRESVRNRSASAVVKEYQKLYEQVAGPGRGGSR